MATIKDIARAAGVSHATVSNVLSHKGNVSAEKVKLVQDTARAMGYRRNEAASSLRSGHARLLAVILPDAQSAAHSDLFKALCHEAALHDYGVMLRVTDNIPARERRAIREVLSARAECVVAVSSLTEPQGFYAPLIQSGARVRMALRGAPEDEGFCGFDMEQAGREIARRVLESGAARVGLMTNMLIYPAERRFFAAFTEAMGGVPVRSVQAIASQYGKQAFALLDEGLPGAVVTTCEEMAQAVLSAASCAYADAPAVYTLCAARLLPPRAFVGYQLNYRALGRALGEHLLSGVPSCEAPPPLGFAAPRAHVSLPRTLRMLSIDNPATGALRRLSPMLRRETGLILSITTLPTADVTRVLERPEAPEGFDLARMDVALLGCYAETLFETLSDLHGTMPELADEYARAPGGIRALPFDPSCLLLFYRRDLFENPRFQRAYFERYHTALRVPSTFAEYTRVADFFDGYRAETHARGALVTRQASECISYFLSLSPDGVWPAPDEQAMAAYVEDRRRLEAVSLIAPDGNWNTALDRFAHGESATLIAHGNYAERLSHNPLARASGRVGYAPAPGGRPLLGGGVLGVCRHCADPSAASAFLDWLYSDSVANLMALLGGASPCAAAYENEEILDVYPWLVGVREGLRRGVRRGIFPAAPRPFHQLRLEQRISFACVSAISGALSPAQALQAIRAAYP